MSGTLLSLAQSPIARRDFPVAPEPVVPPGVATMHAPSQNFPTTQPSRLGALASGALGVAGNVAEMLIPPSPEQYLALQQGYSIPRGAEVREFDDGPRRRDENGAWVPVDRAGALETLAGLFPVTAGGPAGTFGAGPSRGIRAYHGGPGSVDWAAPNTRRGAIDEWRATPDNPTFFAASPARASEYAVARYPDRAAVYPVELDQSSMLSWNQADSWRSNNDLAQMAKEQGARVVEMRNAYDGISDGAALARVQELLGRKPASGPETIYMVLDPSAISPARGR